jgi:hypothetical protein
MGMADRGGAIDGFGAGDHGDLMVFVSRQIKVQPRAA